MGNLDKFTEPNLLNSINLLKHFKNDTSTVLKMACQISEKHKFASAISDIHSLEQLSNDLIHNSFNCYVPNKYCPIVQVKSQWEQQLFQDSLECQV